MRIISRLDVKENFLIKGIQLEGWRKYGDPVEEAKKQYINGIDEIFVVDVVASLYGRNNSFSLLEKIAKNIFIPITLSGGIRTLDDVSNAFWNGADKIGINSGATSNSNIISKIAKRYGSQAVVVNIEVKKKNNEWLVLIENGRTHTEKDLISWIKEIQEKGAGEIYITSIDKDGTLNGPDFELINYVKNIIEIPVVYGGGIRNQEDISELEKYNFLSGVTISSGLYKLNNTAEYFRQVTINEN